MREPIFSGLKIRLHTIYNQCSSLLLLMVYGAINDSIWQNTNLKLRKIYEYASELGFIFAFSLSKTAISSNILLGTSDTLSQKHILSGLKLHLHNTYTIDAVPCYYLHVWYGVIYKRQYTDKTLTEKIYEYASERGASELGKFFAFSHSKTGISFIYLRNIYIFFQVSNYICIIHIQSMQFPVITYGMALYIKDSIPTKHWHWENPCICERAERASLGNFRHFTF